jgi:hypothetical protein
MGQIVSSKRENDKVVVEVQLDHEELVQLKGQIDNVHLFSEQVADCETKISRRGKNEATKYFLIPRYMRRDIKLKDPVNCQRIDTEDKAMFVYTVTKLEEQFYKNKVKS